MTNLERAAAWILAILWVSPLIYAFWAAFHPPAFATTFDLLAPITLANFEKAWGYAPFPRHFMNTVMLVTMILGAQLVASLLTGITIAGTPVPAEAAYTDAFIVAAVAAGLAMVAALAI